MQEDNAHIKQLTAFFEQSFRLNEKEKNEVAQLFTERRLKRRSFLLQPGDVCRHFSFVVAGCFKMFAVDNNGKEHNLEFAAESDWLCDLASFYDEKPAGVYIEAMEPAIVLQIKRADVIHLYANYPKFNTSFRVITEHKYIQQQTRVLQHISATAEERYLHFIQHYPALVNRLPNVQVASYLGITSEFLSKIRKDLAHNRLKP